MVFLLRMIARGLSGLLVLNLFCRLIREPFLPWFHDWMLTCPNSAARCHLLWQRWPFVERVIWKILDYIEIHHYA
ncbi:LAFA_0D11914g1_1 [Lachancea sp. 'fantastica']|nr:LAFA_0D11914g1_1 [Lachancea sp. 'fantastica']